MAEGSFKMRQNGAVSTYRLNLTGDPAADDLLGSNPLALLIGMVLDQQIPMEWAFRGPEELRSRLGVPLVAAEIAGMDPDKLAEVFSTKPALHRYPGSMAARTQALCQTIVDEFGGRAETIWLDARDGADLYRRIKALPGFGEMKAKIFIALLGKQCGLATPGWEAVSTPYSEPGARRSVADIVDSESLEQVRAFKAQAKKAAKGR
jgi:uncharacterized HhH-GPD family protein